MNDDRADLHLDRTPTGKLDQAVPGSPLTPLRRLHNYRVAAGDPDVRGWQVLGADGRPIGEVEDLLVDTEALRVRYLDVALGSDLLDAAGASEAEPPEAAGPIPGPESGAVTDPGLAPYELGGIADPGGLGAMLTASFVRSTLSDTENEMTREYHGGPGTRHVLIPIGNARLDPEHDRILAEGLRAADAPGLPDYRGQGLSRDDEAVLRQRFDQAYIHSPERDFYAHDLYDEDRFYAPRRPSARAAGLAPGRSAGAPVGTPAITGELDRAVNAPDHNVTRDAAGAPREEADLPVRGR